MNKKIYIGLIIAILIFGGLIYSAMIFKNDIKAAQMGIDVRYLDDMLYCEQDSDCIYDATQCGVVNKQHNDPRLVGCDADSPSKVFCNNNRCMGEYRGYIK